MFAPVTQSDARRMGEMTMRNEEHRKAWMDLTKLVAEQLLLMQIGDEVREKIRALTAKLDEKTPDRLSEDQPPFARGALVRTRPTTFEGAMENPNEWPKSVDDLLHRHGAELRERFPALDGRNGRTTLAEECAACWGSYEKKRYAEGHGIAFAAVKTWIAGRYWKHAKSLEADQKNGQVVVTKAPEKSPERAHADHEAIVNTRHTMRVAAAMKLGLPKPPHPDDPTFEKWFNSVDGENVRKAMRSGQ